jgi:hypothetical protein
MLVPPVVIAKHVYANESKKRDAVEELPETIMSKRAKPVKVLASAAEITKSDGTQHDHVASVLLKEAVAAEATTATPPPTTTTPTTTTTTTTTTTAAAAVAASSSVPASDVSFLFDDCVQRPYAIDLRICQYSVNLVELCWVQFKLRYVSS